jgi:hypothetical protein
MLAGLALPVEATTELYGVGRTLAGDVFYQINTTTAQATPLFSFGNAGTAGIFGLTYNPTTNRFLTVQQVSSSQSILIEIDAASQTAAAVVHGIPTGFFEGIEYAPSLGGVVVSYGPGSSFSGRLALLDSSYALIGNQPTTGIVDGDTLFVDGLARLNVLDPDDPSGSPPFQRNVISNPFASISLAPAGFSNPFTTSDKDAAWKADENRLFLTQTTSLAYIVGPNNIFSIGSFGGAGITGIAVAPVIPEPASIVIVGSVAFLTLRRR